MNTPPPQRRRRWFQFSLRTLMLFTLACALAFGWIARQIEPTRREQSVVSEIESWAHVTYHTADGPRWTHRYLRRIQSVSHLCEWSTLGAPTLEWVRSYTEVTDDRLVHLKELTELESLGLNFTRITDAGLVHLKGLTELKELDLEGTRVSDAGLEHLQGLNGLENLNLGRTQVTDAGLVHLKNQVHLEWLWLQGTGVTDAGVDELQQALPNCTIRR